MEISPHDALLRVLSHMISQTIKRSQTKSNERFQTDIFLVVFGTIALFIDKICTLLTKAKRERTFVWYNFCELLCGLTADRLAQLVERRTTMREVSGSSPRPDT